MAEKKIPGTIAIQPDVRERFSEVCKGRSVKRNMNDAGTRIIDWFCRQEPATQTAIMMDVDTGMEDVYADMLRKLADDLDAIKANDLKDKASRLAMAAKKKRDKPDQQ